MKILVDADAFPHTLREILFRSAERTGIRTLMVSNHYTKIPVSKYIESVVSSGDFNAADDRIIELAEPGDLVITADIPLADRAITKQAQALNPRGELYTQANIKNIVAMREILEDLRAEGEITGGPAPYNPKHRENFINQLNRITTKALKQKEKQG